MPKAIEIGEVTGPVGHWVVVVGGKVIATNEDLRKMLELAEKYPEAETLVTRVLYPQASYF